MHHVHILCNRECKSNASLWQALSLDDFVNITDIDDILANSGVNSYTHTINTHTCTKICATATQLLTNSFFIFVFFASFFSLCLVIVTLDHSRPFQSHHWGQLVCSCWHISNHLIWSDNSEAIVAVPPRFLTGPRWNQERHHHVWHSGTLWYHEQSCSRWCEGGQFLQYLLIHVLLVVETVCACVNLYMYICLL